MIRIDIQKCLLGSNVSCILYIKQNQKLQSSDVALNVFQQPGYVPSEKNNNCMVQEIIFLTTDSILVQNKYTKKLALPRIFVLEF